MGDWQKEYDEVHRRALERRAQRRKWPRRISLILGVIVVGVIEVYGFGWVYFVNGAESGSGLVYVWLYGIIASLILIGAIVASWKFWNYALAHTHCILISNCL